MHQCEEFRERITEHIIDGRNIAEDPEYQRELLVCQSCSEFYSESKQLIEAFSSVQIEMPEAYWASMADRLRSRIVSGRFKETSARRWLSWAAFDWRNLRVHVPALAGVAVMALITFALYRVAVPLIEEGNRARNVSRLVVLDHNVNLDPVTLEFLEQSELLLREVMNLEPSSAEDVEEARQTASQHLMDIDQRKQAASEVPPVIAVMDNYETILRDIRNLDAQTAAEDIEDIQTRIQKNGLIANMKVFQPKVSVVEIVDQ